MKTIRYINGEYPDAGGWKGRHSRAVERGIASVRSHRTVFQGDCLVQGINAWCEYASAYERRYEASEIGNDLIGDWWKDWGLALHKLLDAESGDLDCGTLSAIILGNLTEQGFKEGVDW